MFATRSKMPSASSSARRDSARFPSSSTPRKPRSRDAIVARCDRRAIRQVFINLLSNAVKYNTEGGRIWIALRCADPITITVRDSGPGLTAEQIGRLFQPFERLGAERRGIQGNGLGLLICKELVEAMGGSIDVHSVAGQGCTFAVSLMAALPRRSQSPEAALRAA